MAKIRTFAETDAPTQPTEDTPREVVRSPDEQVEAYYRDHAKDIVGYLTSVFGAKEDAEEVTQEAFLRLHETLLTGERIERPKAWIFTVARRLLLNLVKERRGHAAKAREVARALDEAMRDTATTAERALTDRQRQAALARALQALSPLERQCFDARCRGLKLREVAAATEIDLRRVSEVVWRAIEKLQEQIGA
jgi:RNA polymerase sigma factor (sigma-70 family)